jgi:hypothetical protein
MKSLLLSFGVLRPVRSAYQPPASSTFLSERTRHKQPAATSQQYSSLRTNQHQPSATSQPNRPLVRVTPLMSYVSTSNNFHCNIYIVCSKVVTVYEITFRYRKVLHLQIAIQLVLMIFRAEKARKFCPNTWPQRCPLK